MQYLDGVHRTARHPMHGIQPNLNTAITVLFCDWFSVLVLDTAVMKLVGRCRRGQCIDGSDAVQVGSIGQESPFSYCDLIHPHVPF